MSSQLDLKEIEQKAFRSVYQDGLWDIYYGLVVISMAVFMFRPPQSFSPANILLALLAFTLSYLLFRLGKTYITLPRMGQVKFGAQRAKRTRTMVAILGVVVLVQAVLVIASATAWLDSQMGLTLNDFLVDRKMMDLAVASIGALFAGSGMTLVAFLRDFPRGYYIALLMMLAVFLMIYLNNPIFPIILGGLIILPGVVLFIRFLAKHPRPQLEEE